MGKVTSLEAGRTEFILPKLTQQLATVVKEVHTYNFCPGEAETGRSQGLASQPV